MARLSLRERLRVPTYGDPEEIQAGEVAFDYDRCSGCGICAQACPAKAILFADKRPSLKPCSLNECIACGDCAAICPEGAIRVVKGYRYTGLYKTIDHGEIQPPRL